jgi:hypothetical protein
MARSSDEYKSTGPSEELIYLVELSGFPLDADEQEKEHTALALDLFRREIRLRKRLIQTGVHTLP